MKVILVERVENLGEAGDEKEVKDGFARNWLLPKKLAVLSNDAMVKEIIKKVKAKKAENAKKIDELKKIAQDISVKSIVINVKSGEKGKLFGSVTAEDIAKELGVDRKIITMDPIKEIGEHDVTIKFGSGIESKVKVVVKAKTEQKHKK